jgi:iron complex outermembrane receptor protein
VFGAGLYYKADSWQANLMVRNLTDRVHWTGGYNYGRVFPGDPRSVTLTVNYRF